MHTYEIEIQVWSDQMILNFPSKSTCLYIVNPGPNLQIKNEKAIRWRDLSKIPQQVEGIIRSKTEITSSFRPSFQCTQSLRRKCTKRYFLKIAHFLFWASCGGCAYIDRVKPGSGSWGILSSLWCGKHKKNRRNGRWRELGKCSRVRH